MSDLENTKTEAKVLLLLVGAGVGLLGLKFASQVLQKYQIN